MKIWVILTVFFLFTLGACAPIPAAHVVLVDNSDPISIDASFRIDRTERDGLFFALCFSSDGKRLLTSESGGDYLLQDVHAELNAWNVENRQKQTLATAQGHFWGNAWSHDGKMIAVCEARDDHVLNAGENRVRLLDAATGREIRNISAMRGLHPNRIVFSLDDSLLVWTEINLSTDESRLVVLALKTGESISSPGAGWSYRDDPVFVTPDNLHIYWRYVTWELQLSPRISFANRRQQKSDDLEIFAMSPDGRMGYTVDALYRSDFQNPAARTGSYHPEALYEIDLATWKVEVRRDFVKPRKVMFSYSYAISPNGRLAAIGTQCDRVHIIDLQTNKDTCRLMDSKITLSAFARNLCFSPDGRYLAGAATIGLSVWKLPSQE